MCCIIWDSTFDRTVYFQNVCLRRGCVCLKMCKPKDDIFENLLQTLFCRYLKVFQVLLESSFLFEKCETLFVKALLIRIWFFSAKQKRHSHLSTQQGS